MANLNDLDLEDIKKIGNAPLPVRIGVIAFISVLLLGAFWYFAIQPQLERIKGLELQEQTLREDYDVSAAKAANLDAYKEQLDDMRNEFAIMLRQLPDRVDIESLLVDLSQTSVGAGLEVQYFKPQGDLPKEFYAEHPIRLSVKGKYHEFGEFVSGLAALPRIVTLSNIVIKHANTSKDGSEQASLVMDLTATTYRYLREDE